MSAVVVSHRYQNVSDAALDATLLLPFGAWSQLGVVCDWLVQREGDETLAAVSPAKEATGLFKAATGTLLPRLETSVREPTFVCATGNLLPGQEIVIKFSFICPLASTATAGFLGIVIPLNYGAGSGVSFDVEIALDIALDFSDISAFESPTHELHAEISRRRGRVTVHERQVRQSGEFVLKIGTPQLQPQHPHSFVEKSAVGELSAIACFQPTASIVSATQRTVVIVIDGMALSAAAEGAWQQCREFLNWFMSGLTNSEVSVVFVGSDKIVRLVNADAVRSVLKMAPEDGSHEDAAKAFDRVYENFAAHKEVEVLFIGDGEGIANVPSLIDNIKSHAAKFRVFVFGMGVVNRYVMQGIADHGQGRAEFAYVRDSEGGLAQKAQYLARCIEQSPMSVQVEWGNLNPILHPVSWWDHAGIFSGDLIYVLANLPVGHDSMTVKLNVSCPDLTRPLPALKTEVVPRKYVKCDNVALMAERCLLADQCLAVPVDKADILERSTELAIAVPGHTAFSIFTEDPALGTYLALVTLVPLARRNEPLDRPLPNTKPYPLKPSPGKRSASIMDITRARPRATMAASASSALSGFSDSDEGSDSDDDEKSFMGKSLDSSSRASGRGGSGGAGGQKKAYDMSSLLKFRQASLDGAGASSGMDIASMSASPKVRAKKRGARGASHKESSGGSSPARSKSPGSGGGKFGRGPPRERQKTLIVGENAWRPKKLVEDDELLADLATMRGILNKVTSKKIGYFIEQLFAVGITTPQHLKGLIELIFERVLTAQSMTPMYADLCFQMSAKCPSFPDPEGAGNEWTFRRLLLNRCQREFEDKDKVVSAASDKTVGDLIEAEFKMKRRILGNIRFVGELYRLGMLGSSIVVNCIVQLLPLDRLPEVEDLEVLCNLVTTAGAMLEKHSEKSAVFVRDLFAKLQKLSANKQLEARIRFKLLDLIDLRANGWRPVDTTAKGFGRRRPSAPSLVVSRVVREVVSVGGQRAGSRAAEVQPPVASAIPGAMAAERAQGLDRSSWGGLEEKRAAGGKAKDDGSRGKSPSPPAADTKNGSKAAGKAVPTSPTTSPKQSTHRRHNADTSALEKSAKDALEEYFLSYDVDEAIICISELDSPGWLHRVVFIAVSTTFASVSKRKLVLEFLQKMLKEKMLDEAMMMRGFEDLIIELPTLLEDSPNAPIGIGRMLGALFAASSLSVDSVTTIDFGRHAEKDASSMVLIVGSLYDELVAVGAKQMFASLKLHIEDFEPDQESRSKALKRTEHAIQDLV